MLVAERVVRIVTKRGVVADRKSRPLGDVGREELACPMTVLIEIAAAGEGSRVAVTGTGFRPDAEFDQLYAMFRGGNALTLENLRRSFVDGPIDWTAGRAEAETSIETDAQ